MFPIQAINWKQIIIFILTKKIFGSLSQVENPTMIHGLCTFFEHKKTHESLLDGINVQY